MPSAFEGFVPRPGRRHGFSPCAPEPLRLPPWINCIIPPPSGKLAAGHSHGGAAGERVMHKISEDKLQYVHGMLRELRDMTVGDEFLSYLIEVAYLETSDALRRLHADASPGPGTPEAA